MSSLKVKKEGAGHRDPGLDEVASESQKKTANIQFLTTDEKKEAFKNKCFHQKESMGVVLNRYIDEYLAGGI